MNPYKNNNNKSIVLILQSKIKEKEYMLTWVMNAMKSRSCEKSLTNFRTSTLLKA